MIEYFEIRRDFSGMEEDSEGNPEWWGDDAIAAYQFKGSTWQTKALKDRTGNGYDLTRKPAGSLPTWTDESGYYFPAGSWLVNNELNKRQDIKTIIVRYSDMPSQQMLSNINGSTIYNPVLCYGINVDGFSFQRPAAIVASSVPNLSITYYGSAKTADSSGVLACTNKKVFFNGEDLEATKRTAPLTEESMRILQIPKTLCGSGGYIIAAAFYAKVLTASRIADISEDMLKI